MKIQEQELKVALEKIGLQSVIQKEQKQVMTSISVEEREYPFFFKPIEHGNILHIMAFVPCSVHDDAANELSRFLHLINKEIDMPGFGWDEESKTVFYRVVIPCLHQQMEEPLLHAYVDIIRRVCGMFGTIIHAVAIRAMTLDEVFEQATEVAQKKK